LRDALFLGEKRILQQPKILTSKPLFSAPERHGITLIERPLPTSLGRDGSST
jgi:hypothetical protein